ncbi:MAG: hypothetical protein WCR96_00345 [Candidatus Methanomethylophilaceae archaeon]
MTIRISSIKNLAKILLSSDNKKVAGFKHFFINAETGKTIQVSSHIDYIRSLKVGKTNSLGLNIKEDPNVSQSPILTKQNFVREYPCIIISWYYPDIGIMFSSKRVNPHKCFILIEKFELSNNFEREEVTFDNTYSGKFATLLWTRWLSNSETENQKFISRFASSRQASDFQDVSDLQFEFRKSLFDLYSQNKDDKTDEYFKNLKNLEKEQKNEIQKMAKSIYDEVKESIGHSKKIGGKEVENKYNFWLYKGNTGMKITVLQGGKKIMTLKCGRDINHETSGAEEKVLTILGNEDELNKKKDKDKFVIKKAKTAKDIIKIYDDALKQVV